ncbi:MAG: hypothetical protein MHM6MM_001826 [Cercozoa sp. M6MM]
MAQRGGEFKQWRKDCKKRDRLPTLTELLSQARDWANGKIMVIYRATKVAKPRPEEERAIKNALRSQIARVSTLYALVYIEKKPEVVPSFDLPPGDKGNFAITMGSVFYTAGGSQSPRRFLVRVNNTKLTQKKLARYLTVYAQHVKSL